MALPRPARLYQKSSGVFFIRVLLRGVRNRPELKRSLRTTNATLARSMASSLNALLECVPNEMRAQAVDEFMSHTVSKWTLPGGIGVADDDDQRRLTAFLNAHPLLEQAIAYRIAGFAFGAGSPTAHRAPGAYETAAPQGTASSVPVAASTGLGGAAVPLALHVSHVPLPRHPMRLSHAAAKYADYYKGDLSTQNKRTSKDKNRLLVAFGNYIAKRHPQLGADPQVHLLDSTHVLGFLAEQSKRPGKRVDKDGNAVGSAPNTKLKKLMDMTHFFAYLRSVAKATNENLAADLSEAAEAYRAQAKKEDVHYEPFSDRHIAAIFEPARYLAFNRDPDYFWAPILGLHLACRLGDFVRAQLKDIGQAEGGVWYIDVTPEEAKNENSIRRLPITEPLIRLGFLEYVEHVRSLGATYLFPHRDWTTSTAQEKPSKNQSQRFAAYLDSIEIKHPKLVFHSFRHTGVSAMQDSGVPLAHAMQIAGHEAQVHAVKTGKITESQARSVHLSHYTHADLERMGNEYPLLALKLALERSIKPQIDHGRLAKAAKVVKQHLKKVGGEFKAGWPALRSEYTTRMLGLLDE